ncbi:Phospholipase/carboxylesterase [Punctularia strigosozonata HHB-11173 SS5]|uniref:Phospholipase/carboxylesterase n=1 Tax=Punctularia strigosozonata (strain HHB-11173) TaxID=741275 RepID=UPI0004417EFA|nr:Phospholipase/carboxylesterase [Punctularia strigosozonata HHB-11173 SS5]EIN11067.1 Phospholipase/carboxylesterase [Punctularia strigosozonata HHB-11173 SS5]
MTSPPQLKYVTVEPSAVHTASFILVHGLGDSGNGLKPVAESISRNSALSHIKWILPNAPVRRVTVNRGALMPAWFDIFQFGSTTQEDEQGMQETAQSLNELISAEVANGVDPSRIVLGGFSQGGVMTLLAGLSNERKLGGLVVLSGRVPLMGKFKDLVSSHATEVPIFWGHGTEDPVVRFDLARNGVQLLQELGVKSASPGDGGNGGLSFHAYEGLGHSLSAQEIEDLSNWLQRVVPAK